MVNLFLDNIDIYEKKTASFANLLRLNSFIFLNYKDLDLNIYINTNDEKKIIKFIKNLSFEDKFLFKNIFINNNIINEYQQKYKSIKDKNNYTISYDLKIKGLITKDYSFIKRLNELINKLIFHCPAIFNCNKLINLILFKSKIKILNLKKENSLNQVVKSKKNIFLFIKCIFKLIFSVRFSPSIKEFYISDLNFVERIY